MPTLGFQRTASFDTKSLAFLKSHAATFTTYATDWKDRLPFFTDPSQPTTPVTNPARGFTVNATHFSSHIYWTVALAEPYYEGDHQHESFYYPGGGLSRPGLDGPVEISPYWYGCSFVGAPEYWNARTRVPGISQLRPNSLSDAIFPAAKMLMLEGYPALQIFEPRATPAGMNFLDGSSARVPIGSPQPDSLNDGDFPLDMPRHTYPYPPTMHSTNGIRGRDR